MTTAATTATSCRATRCFEQPPRPARDAGERTRELGRRTLYETTANQAATASKRAGASGPRYENTANGDLRVHVTDRAAKASCMRYSYSQAAMIDARVGAAASRARCGGAAQLRAAHAASSASRKRGGLYEAGQALTRYHDATALLTDTSLNVGDYNRVVYDPNARLDSADAAFPGLVVDPSGAVFARPYASSAYVDICGGLALDADMCLNTPPPQMSTSVSPYVRATAAAAVLDVCLGRPLGRTRFVGF